MDTRMKYFRARGSVICRQGVCKPVQGCLQLPELGRMDECIRTIEMEKSTYN